MKVKGSGPWNRNSFAPCRSRKRKKSNASTFSGSGRNDRENVGIYTGQYGYAPFWNRAGWFEQSKRSIP